MLSTASQIRRSIQKTQPAERIKLNDLEKRLLDAFQKGLPLSATPFKDMADILGTSEALVLKILDRLQEAGVISRIGPVFKPKQIGASTLAAMSVPPTELDQIASVINSYQEVNHNYERENEFNLWFVVTAPNGKRLEAVLNEMEQVTGYSILNLPLIKQHHIDLGFPLWC
ncbi:MAG: Lrp/AsnC family transcriptional regulator [Gammaproteobacteria bacterium]|nr:Lrp/AsnC family transcriptional regulator [Gammaproteobacteria bacterium]